MTCRYHPEIHVIRGRARHPQTQGGVERGNGPFKDALQLWMQDNGTTDWATHGIYIVNQQINLRPKRNKGGASSYEIYYGKKLQNSPLNVLGNELFKLVQTDLGLEAAMKLVAEKGNPSKDEIRAAIEAGDQAFFAQEAELANIDAGPAEGVAGSDQSSEERSALERVDQPPSEASSSAPNDAPVLCQPAIPANEDVTARKRGPSEAGFETHPSDSPRRAALRAGAVAAATRQAKQVNARRAAHSKAVLEVGDVCNLKIEGSVRGATDMPNVPVAVCLVRSSRTEGVPPSYQVASRDGFLKGYIQRDRLDHVPSITMEIMDINFNKPGIKHDLTDAQASALFNVSGGGSKCGCKKTDCASSNLCLCRKKNKFCTTKCHGGRGKNPHCTYCPPS